ncbi:ECF transporter S component [Sporolactobacillus shoreicorticis]|uniref:ECF transporter S component n=1 Tax=Sporolactobacillus shoreicorticis TaxID=1923877 RepID=A0ABW5S645_9BACL|nr:ECF transporter S component [Sporolactobacillus shoreicorticis]MCO7125761.1 ECF transporter S component [Sporolactobacillus shoreicorticis]
MSKEKNTSLKLNLSDILVTIVIALVFGLVFRLLGPVYDLVKPFGLHLDALLYGIWFIAAPFAALLIRKPGVAFLAETAAALAEMLFAGSGGVINLYYGLLQGAFSEAVFAAWRYKKFSIGVASLSAFAALIASIILDAGYAYLPLLAGWNLVLYLVFRVIGSVLFSGLFPYVLVKGLEKTGVTQSLRPVTKEDYDVLK